MVKVCQRVDIIVRISSPGAIFVKCPICGKWGRPNRKSHNTFCIAHPNHTKRTVCYISQMPKFHKFIEDVVHNVHNINPELRQKYIRIGHIPIVIPQIN